MLFLGIIVVIAAISLTNWAERQQFQKRWHWMLPINLISIVVSLMLVFYGMSNPICLVIGVLGLIGFPLLLQRDYRIYKQALQRDQQRQQQNQEATQGDQQ